jgi:hypothetical protein
MTIRWLVLSVAIPFLRGVEYRGKRLLNFGIHAKQSWRRGTQLHLATTKIAPSQLGVNVKRGMIVGFMESIGALMARDI